MTESSSGDRSGESLTEEKGKDLRNRHSSGKAGGQAFLPNCKTQQVFKAQKVVTVWGKDET